MLRKGKLTPGIVQLGSAPFRFWMSISILEGASGWYNNSTKEDFLLWQTRLQDKLNSVFRKLEPEESKPARWKSQTLKHKSSLRRQEEIVAELESARDGHYGNCLDERWMDSCVLEWCLFAKYPFLTLGQSPLTSMENFLLTQWASEQAYHYYLRTRIKLQACTNSKEIVQLSTLM